MRKSKYAELQQTKIQLAEKYERLAKIAGSKPKKRQFQNRADKHRRQAAEYARLQEQHDGQ